MPVGRLCPPGSSSGGPAGPEALQRRHHRPALPVRRLHPGQVFPGLPDQQPDPDGAPRGPRGPRGSRDKCGCFSRQGGRPGGLTHGPHITAPTSPPIRENLENLEPREPEVHRVLVAWRARKERQAAEVRPDVPAEPLGGAGLRYWSSSSLWVSACRSERSQRPHG